jgi:hypothetical protein
MKLYAHRKTESCRWPTEEPVVITHGGAQAPKGMMFQVSPLASMLGAIFCPNCQPSCRFRQTEFDRITRLQKAVSSSVGKTLQQSIVSFPPNRPKMTLYEVVHRPKYRKCPSDGLHQFAAGTTSTALPTAGTNTADRPFQHHSCRPNRQELPPRSRQGRSSIHSVSSRNICECELIVQK